MDRRRPLTTESDRIAHLEPRTQRALAESMHITFARVGGQYTVHAASGRYYDVDIVVQTCSCPDFQTNPPAGGCKHLRRVDMEIRAGRVPTPDGRIPSQTAADGGVSEEAARELPDSIDGAVDYPRIEGPIPEFDAYGEPTGSRYYRCLRCGREAMRQRDLQACCDSADPDV